MGIRRFGVQICAYSILIQSGLGVKKNVLVIQLNIYIYIYSPQPILQLTEGVQWFFFITEKTILFLGSRGDPTFSGGGGGGVVQLFPGCDFPLGGGGGVIPPLDTHMVLVHVHPRNLVLYIQRTRLCSTR